MSHWSLAFLPMPYTSLREAAPTATLSTSAPCPIKVGKLCYKCDRCTVDVAISKILIYLLVGHQKNMKERIIQPKKITTDSFSITALRQPTRGFGSQSSGASFQPVADNPLAHDISRIPLRRPQTKLTINQPGDIYEQQALICDG
ncbi:MAG: hypothetical protein RM338_26900 [Nostoc sp. DedQUE12a]|nr:hypothetical protein [Nostoc sp. DedQUE12a]